MKFMNAGPYPVEIAVCTCPNAWAREMRKRGGTCEGEPFPQSDAHAIRFWLETGSPFIVVTCARGFRSHDIWTRVGLVVHEATHVWQFIKEHLRESAAGDEVEACSVQWISQWLLEQLEAAGWMRR